MQVTRISITFIALGILASCGTYYPVDVAKPSEITIQQAMSDVGDGLVILKGKLSDQYRTGLIVDEVEATFNVSAQATKDDKLVIDVSQPAPAGFIKLDSGQITTSNQALGKRGNQITIKFKNIYTAGVNDLAKRHFARSGSTPDIDILSNCQLNPHAAVCIQACKKDPSRSWCPKRR